MSPMTAAQSFANNCSRHAVLLQHVLKVLPQHSSFRPNICTFVTVTRQWCNCWHYAWCLLLQPATTGEDLCHCNRILPKPGYEYRQSCIQTIMHTANHAYSQSCIQMHCLPTAKPDFISAASGAQQDPDLIRVLLCQLSSTTAGSADLP